ncbi:MAG: Trimethylamine methyltransferase family protein, partial [uncultured Thermoleophilia bacterium]
VRQPHAAPRDPLGGSAGHDRRWLAAPRVRDRDPVRPSRGPRAVPAGRPDGRGRHRQARPRVRARAGREGAERVPDARAEPGERPARGRRPHGLRAHAGSAVRARRRDPQRGHPGRPRALRAARAGLPGARLAGQSRLRAERPRPRLAAPVPAALGDDDLGQGVRRLGELSRGGTGLRGDGGDPVRRSRGDRRHAGDVRRRERQLAAPVRRADAGRAARVHGGRPGRAPDAVPADGRDGPGDDSRRARPAGRRGARGRGAGPARAAGRTRHPRLVPLEHRHAVRLAGVRGAGVGDRPPRLRADRTAARTAVAVGRGRPHDQPDRRRAGGLRGLQHVARRVPGGRELGPPVGGLARGRSGGLLREVHRRRRAAPDPARAVHAARGRRGEPRLRRPRRGAARRPLPGRRPHDGALPRLLLPPDARLDRELRALEPSRGSRRRRPGGRAVAEEARGVAATADGRRRAGRARGVRRAPPGRARRPAADRRARGRL